MVGQSLRYEKNQTHHLWTQPEAKGASTSGSGAIYGTKAESAKPLWIWVKAPKDDESERFSIKSSKVVESTVYLK